MSVHPPSRGWGNQRSSSVLPIYAREEHAVEVTGPYLGILAVGSVLGSFALGAVPHLLPRGPQLPVLLGLFAIGAAALAVATQFSPVAVLVPHQTTFALS